MEDSKLEKEQDKNEEQGKQPGLVQAILRYSDSKDMLLMSLGMVGCFADGSSTPLIMLVLSHIMNKYAVEKGWCWARTAERQTSRLRRKYLMAVLRQDAGFLDIQQGNMSTYQVVSSLSADTLTIQGVLSEKIPNFVMNISTFITSEMVAVYLSWKLAVVAIPALSLLVIPGIVYGKQLGELGKNIQEAYGVAGGIAEQAFSSIRTVYSYVGENRTNEIFLAALERSMDFGIRQGLVKGFAIGSVGIAFAVWSFQAWYGSVLVTKYGAKGGDVFMAGVCIVSGGLALGSSLLNMKSFAEAAITASLISDIIDRVPAIDSEDQRGKTIVDVRGDLEFKDIDFAYPSRPTHMVLRNFNFRVMASQTVGLVGGSGSGKSTVISLVERFYDPLEGEILLDGINIKTLELKRLRLQIGLVNQEPALFATSIKENILFGREGASMEQVISAAKAANAHNFITQLPQSYDTQVGQFGTQMSGGQKQRIAIARALLKDPRILLLDEATSALDSQSEKSVQDALDQASMGRTTVIVAHQLTTLRNADLIAVIQSGQIVECGSHIQLLQNEHGPYSSMVRLHQTSYQSKSFDQHTTTKKHPEHDNSTPSLRFLIQMTRPERNRTLVGCAAAIFFGTVQPIHSFCMGALLSVYFLNDHNEIKKQTKIYCLAFLTYAIITFISSVIQHYSFGFVGEHLTKRVREKMVSKIMTFEIEWFDQETNTSGALCSRLASEANMMRSLICDRLSLLAQVLSAAILAIVLGLILAWRLALVIITLQPLIIGSFYTRGVLMKRMSKKVLKAQNKSGDLASEAIGNHRTIAAFSGEEKMMRLFQNTQIDAKKESLKQSWYAGLGLFVSQFLTTVTVALIFWYGGRLLYHGKVTYKHLFQTFFILVTTGRVIAEAGSMTSDISKGTDALKSVFLTLKRKSKMEPDDIDGIEPEKINGDIDFKDVYFAYPSRPKQLILKGLSLNIEAGKTVALVGQSGSGKSTIIGLIERFYDPLSGSVQIDGLDISSYKLRALRSYIALVSQEPTLFAGTIQDNISYGKENSTEAEIIEAASIANAHEFISCMKDGYDTLCGERGVQLSGGQKQRIALARAILKNPSILLLDEATSALDNRSESLVQEAIEKVMVGRTCVIVAHRLSTIQKAGSIAVIDNGKIAEEGSHNELLAQREKSIYYSLVRLQQNDTLR
ncbi:putative multidrug resistance protein [Actinidia eriantha]|uniref:putative multidrug resistance protein n=1 Tax=Actinidia eriantha TaxID=165200 RepID=UPI00258474E1|nr:putative multidrug resistance protein [Actinidia eriantha]